MPRPLSVQFLTVVALVLLWLLPCPASQVAQTSSRLSKEEFREREKQLKSALKDAERAGKVSSAACSAHIDLGKFYSAQRRFNEARHRYERAVKVCQEATGESLQAAAAMYGLANLNFLVDYGLSSLQGNARGQFKDTQKLLEQCLAIRTRNLPANHQDLIDTHVDLARVYLVTGNRALARQHFEEAIRQIEATLGSDAKKLVRPLTALGQLDVLEGNAASEARFLRAITITEKQFGKENPLLIVPLEGLATIYRKQGRQTEAEAAAARAKEVRSKTVGMRVHIAP